MAIYQELKPLATDQLNQSQQDIQQNFEAIDDLIKVDHVEFGAGEGKHVQVTLPEQAGDPGTAANDVAIYSKLSAVTGETGIFWQKEGAGDVIEMTEHNDAASGYTLLPSGMIIAWGFGSITATNQTSGNITFDNAFAVAPHSVQVTPTGYPTGAAQDSVLQVVGITTALFQVTRNNAYVGTTVNFTYIAIGL